MYLNLFYTAIISSIQKILGKGSGWIIDSVVDPNTNILKYNPLVGSSCIKLSKELNHPRKGLINTYGGLVKIELRVTSYEFKSTSYEFKFTSYEFKSMSYELKFSSYDFKSTS